MPFHQLVWYCSHACQKAAWPTHKLKCLSVEEQAATDPVEDREREIAPADFKCPITLSVMKDPVTLAGDGMTYERESIERWLNAGNTTSPVTNNALTNTTLAPSQITRNMIAEWRAERMRTGPS